MSASDTAGQALVVLNWLILGYFLLINAFYGVLLVSAFLEMRRHRLATRGERRWRVLSSGVAPRISILAPAYNEEATVADSVHALLGQQYPNLELLVINDGSRDRTLEVLIERFELTPILPIYQRRLAHEQIRGLFRSGRYPSLVVVDKENGGKADALNAGLNIASGDLVCAIDADTLIEPDALQRMVRPFLVEEGVLAVGGTIRVVNDCTVEGARVVARRVPRRPLAGFQVVEYLRAFLYGRLGWNRLGGNLIISGAFGLFHREAMVEAGGYLHDTVGEDMEMVVRLRRRGYERRGPSRVAFVPDPVAWTEVPETLRVLGRQRDRWHRGLCDVLWRHRPLLFNPRYGAVGLVVYPYFLFAELLGPVVEAVGLLALAAGLALGLIDMAFALLFFLVAYGLNALFTVMTLLLDEWAFASYRGAGNRARLLLWALLEHLGYRQLTVGWRLMGIGKYLLGVRTWGAMERRGFKSLEPPSPPGRGPG